MTKENELLFIIEISKKLKINAGEVISMFNTGAILVFDKKNLDIFVSEIIDTVNAFSIDQYIKKLLSINDLFMINKNLYFMVD